MSASTTGPPAHVQWDASEVANLVFDMTTARLDRPPGVRCLELLVQVFGRACRRTPGTRAWGSVLQ